MIPTAEPSDHGTAPAFGANPLNRARYPFLAPADGPDELGRLDEYRVTRLIGTGAAGFVFAGEDEQLGRAVAIKVLKPELAAVDHHRARFLREARAAAQIESEHVVPVLRVGECAGCPFLVMPLLAGETLQERLQKASPLAHRAALAIARDTARGLVAIHARGFVHRDIKPSNIWLDAGAEPGGPPRARVLDFGLARRSQDASLTATGFVVGTPHYMSPEQARGGAVDPRSDLFSLGCVLFAALTGELPFPGQSATAVMASLARDVPPPVSALNRDVPRAVSDVVAALLQKLPEDRVRTAEAAVALFDAALAGRPVALGRGTRRGPTRRTALLALAGAPVAVGAWLAVPNRSPPPAPPTGDALTVAVLYARAGTMSVSENPVIDATLLALEELNAAGGVLGRRVKPVVLDDGAVPELLAKRAEQLFVEGRTVAAFGCWTSASRKAVRPVVERYGVPLFYPVQYEGLEESPRIVHLGPAPNQQLIPAIEFAIRTLKKKRVALIGSDYVFPRTAHAIIRDHIQKCRERGDAIEFVGEDFLPLGTADVMPTIGRIRRVDTDVVINTINGSTNGHFFAALRNPLEPQPQPVTTISVSISENEVRGLNPDRLTDDYIVASYFESLPRVESREFVARVRAKYGPDHAVNDMMAAAYSGVHLWAKAATVANTAEPDAVLRAVRGLEFDGPRARLKIDPVNLHAWLPVRIGKVRPNGAVAVVGGSDELIAPVPFPNTRTRTEWDQFLRGMQMKWGGRWQAPEK